MFTTDERRNSMMKSEDIAKTVHEAKEIKDMRDDLRDIETIFAYVNAGYGYDRSKAEEIICKNNAADPVVMARNNNPATTIPLSRANDQTILNNLAFLHSYLSGKLATKLEQEAKKGNRNAYT